MVEAHYAFWISEWLKEMSESIGGRKRAYDGTFPASVTSKVGVGGKVGVCRVTDCEVCNVACCDPGDHEDPEEHVANPGEAQVFEAFRGLRGLGLSMREERN